MFQAKSFFITGAAGFVGTNIIRRLLALNEDLRIIATYHHTFPRLYSPKITYIQLDLRIPHVCDPYLKNIDYVIMAAGYVGGASLIQNSPESFLTDSTLITLNVLSSLQNSKKVLFISSSMVYPESKHPLKETDAFQGEPFYKYFSGGWGKRIGEIVCKQYAYRINNPIKLSIIRIDNIYGPYDNFSTTSSHVVASLIRKAVNKQNPFEIWGTGEESKDFLYIDDLIDGIFLALLKDSPLEVYNIASGKNISINNLAKIILNKCNFYPEINYNQNKPSTILFRSISIEKAKKELGFFPKTSLQEGISNTLCWYKKHFNKL